MKRLLGLAIAILLLGGCVTTVEDARAAKGPGAFRVYQKSYDVVWSVIVESINASGLILVSADRESGRILARRPPTMGSWGENVAIFVRRQREDDNPRGDRQQGDVVREHDGGELGTPALRSARQKTVTPRPLVLVVLVDGDVASAAVIDIGAT